MAHKFKPLSLQDLHGDSIDCLLAFSEGRSLEATGEINSIASVQSILFAVYNGKNLLYKGPHIQLAVDVYNDLTRTEQLFPEEVTFSEPLNTQLSRTPRSKRKHKLL